MNQAALGSQAGACHVLEALKVPFVRSGRYHQAWQADFQRLRERQEEERARRAAAFAPRIAALAEKFPKFAKYLQKRAGEIDTLAEPASEEEIAAVEKTLGVPLPASYRTFLKCTANLGRDGFWLGLDQTGPHPAKVFTAEGAVAAFCIAEYSLEGDGDQVLLECRSNPEPDPPVFYYDHGAVVDAARKLAVSFSGWIESLPRSVVFRG